MKQERRYKNVVYMNVESSKINKDQTFVQGFLFSVQSG